MSAGGDSVTVTGVSHHRPAVVGLFCKRLSIGGVGVERVCRQWYEPGHHISFQYRDKGDRMEMNIMATVNLSLVWTKSGVLLDFNSWLKAKATDSMCQYEDGKPAGSWLLRGRPCVFHMPVAACAFCHAAKLSLLNA